MAILKSLKATLMIICNRETGERRSIEHELLLLKRQTKGLHQTLNAGTASCQQKVKPKAARVLPQKKVADYRQPMLKPSRSQATSGYKKKLILIVKSRIF